MFNKHTDECPNTKPKFVAHYREKDGAIQTVSEHLEGTSFLGGKFASKIGLEKHGELLGLLHDLGKASSEFNRYIGSVTGLIDADEDDYVDAKGKKGKIDHATAGAQVIYRHCPGNGNENLLPYRFYLW